jgi:predicted transcriptional regulator of viral defense system
MRRTVKNRPYGGLDSWIEALPPQGRYAFTREEAMAALGFGRKDFNQAARRLAVQKKIARIHGSFYVVVPLEHLAVGVIPADWFIVALMEHLQRPFYVGGLSAAALHGAAHQRPQWLQVVTDRPLRKIRCRGVGIQFFVKSEVGNVPSQPIKTVTGFLPASTPEATALDLIRYCRRVGGLNHVLAVLQELGESIDPAKLVKSVQSDGNMAYAQRLGWLLEQAGFVGKTKSLADWLMRKNPFAAKLEPAVPIRGSTCSKRWHLWLNTEVEKEEI